MALSSPQHIFLNALPFLHHLIHACRWRRLDHVRFMHCFAGARGAAVSCKGGALLEFTNIEVSDCRAGESSGEGGAMSIDDGVLRMVDSRIFNCVASGENSLGGGIMSRGSSQVDLIRVTLVDCSAEKGGGLNLDGNGSLIGVHVEGCEATYGGGLFMSSDSIFYVGPDGMAPSKFVACVARFGGGMYIDTDGEVTIHDTRIEACRAITMSDARGGGLEVNGKALMTATIIEDCASEWKGASVYVGGGLFDMRDSLITRGYTSNPGASQWGGTGGGLQIEGSARVVLTRTTISDCEAVSRGGAVVALNGATVELIQVGIHNCSSPLGSAVLVRDVQPGASFRAALLEVSVPCGAVGTVLSSPDLTLKLRGLRIDRSCGNVDQQLLGASTQLVTCSTESPEDPLCGPLATCSESAVVGAPDLNTTLCGCELPTYPAEATATAPYIKGCLLPSPPPSPPQSPPPSSPPPSSPPIPPPPSPWLWALLPLSVLLVAAVVLLVLCYRRFSLKEASLQISRDRANMDLQMMTHQVARSRTQLAQSRWHMAGNHSGKAAISLAIAPTASLPPGPPSSSTGQSVTEQEVTRSSAADSDVATMTPAPLVAPLVGPSPSLHDANCSAPLKRPAQPESVSAPRAKKKAFTSPWHVYCQEQRPLLMPLGMTNRDREKLLGAAHALAL